jgi:hypothetical protein
VSLGSQANRSAILTNEDRCFVWAPSALSRSISEAKRESGFVDELSRAMAGMKITSCASQFTIIDPFDSATGILLPRPDLPGLQEKGCTL